MKIYLAAAYSRHPEMQGYAKQLEDLGHTITARWIYGTHQAEDDEISGPSQEKIAEWAEDDMADVRAADLVVSFTDGPSKRARGGRHAEFGMALAWHKGLILIGPREHVFHYLPQVEHYDTFAAWLAEEYMHA